MAPPLPLGAPWDVGAWLPLAGAVAAPLPAGMALPLAPFAAKAPLDACAPFGAIEPLEAVEPLDPVAPWDPATDRPGDLVGEYHVRPGDCLYIPLGFATDTFIYRFRQRRKQAR